MASIYSDPEPTAAEVQAKFVMMKTIMKKLTAKEPQPLTPEERALAVTCMQRRLAGSSLTSHDAPTTSFIFGPILLLLMLVFFMYRKPIQKYFSGSSSAKPSYG